MTEHKLFDHLKAQFNLKNDAALARFLEMSPGQVSKVRHGRLPFGAEMILNVHEITDMPIKDIKALLA